MFKKVTGQGNRIRQKPMLLVDNLKNQQPLFSSSFFRLPKDNCF